MVVDLLLGVAANMGFCVCSMFCCKLSCVPLCFAIILIGRESLLLLYFVFFLVSFKCFAAISHSAVGKYAICDCVIS